MRRFGRRFVLFCIAAVLLAGTAFADSGPKPQLVVKVENGPEEPYYLDLVETGEGKNGLGPDELRALDQDMLEALLEAVPEGSRACVTQGTGVPIWGELEGQDGVHTFGYFGVPHLYRILIVTQSGEVWLSEHCVRKVLQSSVTVDWAARSVKTPPVWVGYVLQFLATLVPTLVIEGALLLAFGFDWRRNWRQFLLVNLVTQGLLAAFVSYQFIQNGVGMWVMILLIACEIVIAAAEALIYRKALVGRSGKRGAAYGLAANAASAIIGWYLAEPVWRWIVTIS